MLWEGQVIWHCYYVAALEGAWQNGENTAPGLQIITYQLCDTEHISLSLSHFFLLQNRVVIVSSDAGYPCSCPQENLNLKGFLSLRFSQLSSGNGKQQQYNKESGYLFPKAPLLWHACRLATSEGHSYSRLFQGKPLVVSLHFAHTFASSLFLNY